MEIGYMDLVNMVCSRRRGGNRARSSSDLDNMGCSLRRGVNRDRSSSVVREGWVQLHDLDRQRNVTRAFEHDPTGEGGGGGTKTSAAACAAGATETAAVASSVWVGACGMT